MGTRAVAELFGPYVEAPPRAVVRPGPQSRTLAGRAATPPVAPDDLRLETGVVSRSPFVRRRRWLTASCSVVAHSIGLAATVAVPFLLSSTLPEPAGAVQVFLVGPLVAPPPPPPPPAPARRTVRATPEAVPDQPASFVAPIEVPSELEPEEGLDLGVEGGVAGGVAGGVPGGVIGAIVGGLPDAGAAAPPPAQAFRVSGLIKEPAKIKHVAPVYPPVAVAGRVEGSVIIEALIDVGGRVVEVQILEGNPLFEDAAVEAVRQWIYTPTLLDGVPVSLIMTVTVHFQLERQPRR